MQNNFLGNDEFIKKIQGEQMRTRNSLEKDGMEVSKAVKASWDIVAYNHPEYGLTGEELQRTVNSHNGRKAHTKKAWVWAQEPLKIAPANPETPQVKMERIIAEAVATAVKNALKEMPPSATAIPQPSGPRAQEEEEYFTGEYYFVRKVCHTDGKKTTQYQVMATDVPFNDAFRFQNSKRAIANAQAKRIDDDQKRRMKGKKAK